MNFNFQRVKTPAYITSIALVVIGLLFEMGSVPVLPWIFVILGVVLNVMAVSVTSIDETQRAPRGVESSRANPEDRVVIDSEMDTEEQRAVSAAPSRLQRLRPVKDEKPAKQGGSSAFRSDADAVGSPSEAPADGLRDGQPHGH